MSRPRALDLFCGQGGASMGLHRAGFDVVGIDNKPQPRYPFTFIQADALRPPVNLADFDFIWASPPCQAYSVASNQMRVAGVVYPDLVEVVRELLANHPRTCIENVPQAPIRPDLRLHGWMFPELKVIRERWFELSWFMLQPPMNKPRSLLRRGFVSVVGHGTQSWALKMGLRWTADDARRAMGIDWMCRGGLSQAVPPAYSEFIGKAALNG